MPFPFLPAGIVVAVAFLGAVFAVFGVALRLLGGVTSAGHSIATGVAAGLRDWSHPAPPSRPTSSPAAMPPSGIDMRADVAAVAAAGDASPFDDGAAAVATERVHR